MAKIIAPAKGYSGVSASVEFQDGVGYTDKPYLIDWFVQRGYTVEEERPLEAAVPLSRAEQDQPRADAPPAEENAPEGHTEPQTRKPKRKGTK